MHGCKICAQSISTIQYLDTQQAAEEVRIYREEDFTGFINPKPPKAITPAPPKPVEDPMIVLADLADEIDAKRRIWRLSMMELAAVFLVAGVGMSTLMVGLFLIGPLFWVGLPFAIAGVGSIPVTIAATQRKYLAIHEARGEFARAQRRVGQ